MSNCVICNNVILSGNTGCYCDECHDIYENYTPTVTGKKCESCKKLDATCKIGVNFMCCECRDILVKLREKILQARLRGDTSLDNSGLFC